MHEIWKSPTEHTAFPHLIILLEGGRRQTQHGSPSSSSSELSDDFRRFLALRESPWRSLSDIAALFFCPFFFSVDSLSAFSSTPSPSAIPPSTSTSSSSSSSPSLSSLPELTSSSMTALDRFLSRCFVGFRFAACSRSECLSFGVAIAGGRGPSFL